MNEADLKTRHFRSILLLIIFSTVFGYQVQAIAWTDWSAETPVGNIISDNWGPKTLIVQDSFIVSGLQKWYFYDDCIIGTFKPNYKENNKLYFIYNERSNKLDTFNLESSWISAINQKELRPLLWTRWYVSDWHSISLLDIMMWIILVVVLIPVLKVLYRNGLIKKRKSIVLFFIGITVITILIRCKSIFPYSI